MLELQNVEKTFAGPGGPVQALAGVSLSVAPGELVAIRGPSGCGKTTLLLTAGGLLAPDAGAVRLRGQDLYALAGEQRASFRASSAGLVFQQFHLLPYLSVRENVLTGRLGRQSDGSDRRAEELLRHLGLLDRADHRPAALSVGERQRVALARALLADPPILLADEPTGNLDDENGRIVLEQLAALAAQGKSVLLVTHDARAAAYAHRVVSMHAGRCAEEQ